MNPKIPVVTVELFGIARALAGAAQIDVDVPEPTDTATLAAALAAACPALVGSVVCSARDAFLAPNVLLLDGRRAADAATRFVAADRPCVLFVPSGG